MGKSGSSLDLLVVGPAEDVKATFVDAVIRKPGVEGILKILVGLDCEPEQRKIVRRELM
jgi:hypothetical protein